MKPTRPQIQQAAKRYVKIVEWSETDGVFVGSAPPLIGQACHGETEAEVLGQLQVIVEDWVETLLTEGRPLPAAAAKKNYSGRFLVRVSPEVHRRAALKAMSRGASLNQYVADVLAEA